MMHGREKSDPSVVATKPSNKACVSCKASAAEGGSAAEMVEPRVGTEGNADQRSTLRTQGRDSVTQGLARIRQAAKEGKETRFTALLHHVSIDQLREAFYALKRDAAPGVDGLTWRTYEADLERHLADLHERVHKGGPYHPLPSRRRYIPKADGRQRPLAIATRAS
jgi:RNA-directed DNA polymerase